jgi:hypothetical protein
MSVGSFDQFVPSLGESKYPSSHPPPMCVDSNLIPTMLLKHVDIVTSGVSPVFNSVSMRPPIFCFEPPACPARVMQQGF